MRSLLAAAALLFAGVTSATTDANAQLTKMTIATGVDPAFAQFYVAKEGGLFEKNGLDVTINTGPSGSAMVPFLVNNQVQAAYGSDLAGVINHQVDKNIVAVADGTYLANWESVIGRDIDSLEGLKGKKIGVTAPGSSTNVLANFVLAKAGLKPSDVSIIGVGAGSGAVAAMRAGQVDAISNLDPVITLLSRSGDLKIVTDTRVVAEADRIFGGPMPAGCLYTLQTFLDKNPATAQALANAMVRADHWIQNAGAREIINAVPENYLLGDRAVYVDAFLAAKGALSPDGMFPEAGAETARRALASIDPEIAGARVDLAAIWSNDYVKRANAKYPKG